MFYYTITILNIKTAMRQSVDVCFNSFTTNYFDAWKMAVDKAKEVIDTLEQPFDWVVASIEDTTQRYV